jgi:hypothetical protein
MRLRRLCLEIFALRRFFNEPIGNFQNARLSGANGSIFRLRLQAKLLSPRFALEKTRAGGI